MTPRGDWPGVRCAWPAAGLQSGLHVCTAQACELRHGEMHGHLQTPGLVRNVVGGVGAD